MSQSVNEFDFSSIEEFPADEDQQAINCREMKPLFSKIEKYLSPKPDLKNSILAGQANSPLSKK
jgi:hypothetical protein